jgi:hypothetical protein
MPDLQGGNIKPLPSAQMSATATTAIEAVSAGDEIPILQVAIDENNIALFYKAQNGVQLQSKTVPIAAMDRGDEILTSVHDYIGYIHNTDFTEAIQALRQSPLPLQPNTITP